MTEQQGRGPGRRPAGGQDPERTQALQVDVADAPSERTVPLDGEARPVAGVTPGRAEEAHRSERGPAAPSAPVDLRKGSRDVVPDGTRSEGDAEPPRAGSPRWGPRRAPRSGGSSAARPASSGGRQRRARLRLRAVDPWSVFVLSLLISLFLAVVLVVAVVALYAVLQAAGVPDSINALYAEVTRAPGGGEPDPLLSAGRALTAAGVLAVVDVVLFTALATLSAVLYNLCATFTGGVEVTLAEHDG